MRIDFFELEEVRRFQGYHSFTQHDYGKQPIYLELLVPGQCTPHDLINTILKAWNWENSHVYRFSSNTGTGGIRDPLPDQQRHYEAVAFTKDKNVPSLDAFCLKQFSPVLIEYDLYNEGNHWKWQGTISEVEKDSKQDHVIVKERGGHQPCQYAYQLLQRYLDPLGTSNSPEHKETEQHRMHDDKGKYYSSTKDKVNDLLLSRYKDAAVVRATSHHQQHRREKSEVNREEQRLHHVHDARMKARGTGLVSNGLAY